MKPLTSIERQRQKQKACHGKVKHKKQLGAIIHAKKTKNAQMQPYKCQFCDGWHIGKSWDIPKVQARLDQLIGPRPKQ